MFLLVCYGEMDRDDSSGMACFYIVMVAGRHKNTYTYGGNSTQAWHMLQIVRFHGAKHELFMFNGIKG